MSPPIYSLSGDDVPHDWPGRARSRLLDVDGIRWHIQRSGSGPALLLVHGTGGSTHSWADAIATLARDYTVLAIDVPGHGFTALPANRARQRELMSITGMAHSVARLLHEIRVAPTLAAGHSAGVPLLMQLALDRAITPSRIVGFNPALIAPPDFYLTLLAPLLGVIVERDIVSDAGAWLARSTDVVAMMLRSSGSPLTDAQRARYQWLCTRPAHVHAALTMMSRWDLPRLLRDWVSAPSPLHVVAGTRDQWVPATPLKRVVDRLPRAVWHAIDAGHLIPDERPDVVIEALQ